MTDETPATGHNLPPIAKLADEMTDHAGKWSHHAGEGEKHEGEIKIRAYQLRVFAEDPAIELQIAELLSKAKVPQTKRSDLFTQYLHLAFHKAKGRRPEKSQISRWSGALKHAWSHDPRPAPEGVLAFIKSEGGDVECARKARNANHSGSASVTTPMMWMIPVRSIAASPAAVATLTGKPELPGRMVKVGKMGMFVFVPRKGSAVSDETTPSPEASPPQRELTVRGE
jgi:hypothetical protein